VPHDDAVRLDLLTGDPQQLQGWHPVPGGEAVQRAGARIAWLAVVHDQNAAARPPEKERGGKPRGATPHDHHVVRR
jgi:hypothetical protein